MIGASETVLQAFSLLKLTVTPGQTHYIQAAAELLERICNGQMALAAKSCDAEWLHELVSRQGRWGKHPTQIQPDRPDLFLAMALQATQSD
jgi:hypothetical protein